MYNEAIKLVRETFRVDDYGNEIPRQSTRCVFGKIKSIGMSEFYNAAQTEYKPECTIILADYRDYDNEQLIIWNDQKYRPIRTYRNGKQLEIVVERRIGDLESEESE